MRRLIIWNLMTLDGYFEGPKPWDLDFHDRVWGEELERFSIEQLEGADMLLFGRKTYDGMAAYWPSATGTIADFMNRLPKVVFSRTLANAEWSNSTVAEHPPEVEAARLKQEGDGDILVFGSGEICDVLLRHGLVDELRLGLAPLLLGRGKPLFRTSAEQTPMDLLWTRQLSNGCLLLSYRPGARIAGSAAAPATDA